MPGRESLQWASRTLHDRLEVTHSNEFRHREPHQSVEKPSNRWWWNGDGVLMTGGEEVKRRGPFVTQLGGGSEDVG